MKKQNLKLYTSQPKKKPETKVSKVLGNTLLFPYNFAQTKLLQVYIYISQQNQLSVFSHKNES